MSHNLRLYHKIVRRLVQWREGARITRVRNLALLITGLSLGTGIHLADIVSEWPFASRDLSLVNRLRRFLANTAVDVEEWYRPVAEQLVAPFAGQRMRLVIDATKVGFGHRLLVVGITYRKRTLPLAWSVHEGVRGHTPVKAQRSLFARVAALLPRDAEVWVLGDTEFQHVPLLRWFQQRGWHFVIRQKGAVKVYQQDQGWQKLNAFDLAEGETRYVGWVRLTHKHNAGGFWLMLHWETGEDEPWYLISDRSGDWRLIRMYKVRMWIEEMYGDMKGHGFDLEATRLRHKDRLSRLFLGVCIAFSWFITLGTWVVKRGFRPLIDRKDRRDKSHFRLGWDWLKRCRRLNQPLRVHFRPYP